MNYFSFYKDGKVLYCLIFAAVLFTFSSSFAGNTYWKFSSIFQQLQVHGTVTDGAARLPGVTIAVKGRSSSTAITDYTGQYLINVMASDTLIVSFIGFKTFKVPVSGRSKIDITLRYDTTTLREVKINAGYYSVKESERTGSISRITSKDIETQPVTNVLATMQGRMAGVEISQNTGLPGSGFEIQIRGQNSLRFNGNSPLYIIDGVPYSSQSIGSNMTSGNMPAENSPLNSINPGDITAIEVLKDADATAIYGSRGANGVVLISTKKGKKGKTGFSTTYSYGFGQVAHFLDVLETPDYLAMRREAFANDGYAEYPEYAYDVNGTWDQSRNTDWQKELIGGVATYSNLQSSLTGGSERTNFLLSGNYSRETTVFPGSFDYAKTGGHVSLNHESQDSRFKISFSSIYTSQSNSLPAIDITSTALLLAPNAPPLYDGSGNLNWENSTFDNPMAALEGKIKGQTNDLVANALLTYDMGAGFTAKGSFGYTFLTQKQLNLRPSTALNPAYGAGSESSIVFTNSLGRNSWIIEPQLNWSHKLGKLSLDALAGTTFQQQKGTRQVNYAIGFANNSLMENPASASRNLVLSSDENLYKYEAFYARLNFNWESRYLLNVTGRRDGSSRFGPGNQFANFGAVGSAWVFSQENLIKDLLPVLSFGKLRASYGTTGNDQIGDYQYLDTYTMAAAKYQGVSGLQPSRLFNPDFGWETNKKLEVALETGFFNDRIFSTVAWFQNRSSNQLVGIPLPGTTGFSTMQANLDAVVQNRGLELTLRTINIKSGEFSWITSFNITSNKNRLISFPGLDESTFKNQYVIGNSLNITKVFHYTGLDPATGTYQFLDADGDGSVNFGDDQKTIKDLSPKYYGGLQNQLRYKNIELDFLFQFTKQENYNPNSYSPMPGTMANQPSAVLSRWQNPGDTGPYQAFSDSDASRTLAYYQFSSSDAAISDASYIRLKNISLTYQLPQSLTKKFNCKIGLQGQNVFTITKYKGIDPEFKYTGYMPPLRVFTTSIQLTF
jgi:TonB-linked SusC/RagA family outer membrane protein